MKLKRSIILLLLPLGIYCQNMSKTDSLLLDKYFKAGVPSLKRSWSQQDYKKAIETILELNKTKTLKLPDHKTVTAGILNRITDYTKYWFFESKNFNTVQKMGFQAELMPLFGQLLSAYALEGYKPDKKLKYSYEVTACTIDILKLMDQTIILCDRFLSENANLNDTQKQGLAEIKYGFNTSISGVFTTLEKDFPLYEEEDLCKIARSFFEFYNKNRSSVDATSRNEFDKRTVKLNKEGKLQCVRLAARLSAH